ncbi:MAG TPA: hypothetical protein PKY63_07890 [Bacteroidales bacterium]|nr:hypothetical protein [Bacteroidales bacterium]
MKKLLFTVLVSLFVLQNAKAQSYVISNDIDWATYNQNMWGPNGNPWNINMNINLFDVQYDTAVTIGDIVNVLGGAVRS